MKKQQGFTLIELMIVVAIIGILAAIALPAYQNYTARAQASEALTATSGLRTDIAMYLAENGQLPSSPSTGASGAEGQLATAASNLEGKYIGSNITIGTSGVISIPFANGAIANATNSTVYLHPVVSNGQITKWVCNFTAGSDAAPTGDGAELLPSTCQ